MNDLNLEIAKIDKRIRVRNAKKEGYRMAIFGRAMAFILAGALTAVAAGPLLPLGIVITAIAGLSLVTKIAINLQIIKLEKREARLKRLEAVEKSINHLKAQDRDLSRQEELKPQRFSEPKTRELTFFTKLLSKFGGYLEIMSNLIGISGGLSSIHSLAFMADPIANKTVNEQSTLINLDEMRTKEEELGVVGLSDKGLKEYLLKRTQVLSAATAFITSKDKGLGFDRHLQDAKKEKQFSKAFKRIKTQVNEIKTKLATEPANSQDSQSHADKLQANKGRFRSNSI